MSDQVNDRERALNTLDAAVVDAARYLQGVSPDLYGGYQTAREVLCHFVFWHQQYVSITRALLANSQPALRDGTYAQLNSEATETFSGRTMADLSALLLVLQQTLTTQLRALPDWSVNFPVKEGARPKSVAERIAIIEKHIRGHVRRLRRAERLGEEWVKAYYPE